MAAELVSIKLNKEFRRIYHRGKSFVTPDLILYFTKNRFPFCRLGITTGKKLGSAVKRNRAKRVIRAAYSAVVINLDLSENKNRGYDFVIVARQGCLSKKSTDISKQLLFALKKTGLIKNE